MVSWPTAALTAKRYVSGIGLGLVIMRFLSSLFGHFPETERVAFRI
jgi:hypothetical protein